MNKGTLVARVNVNPLALWQKIQLYYRADSRFVPSQRDTALLYSNVCH